MNDFQGPELEAARADLPRTAHELPLSPLGTMTCFVVAAVGFGVDQLLASLAWNRGHPVWGISLGGLLGAILPVTILVHPSSRGSRGLLGVRLTKRDVGLVVWIVGAALPPLYALSALLSRVFPPPESQLAIYRALIPANWLAFVGGSAVVLGVAPLAEEILFRGLLLRGFAGVVSLPIAVGCSALLFGVSHGSLWLIPPVTLLGCLLGLLTWRTQGLGAAWLGHALFNSVAYVDLCLTHDVRGARLEAWGLRPWAWIPALVLLGWGLVHLRRGLPAETLAEVHYLRD
jgi:membrane protease YdiL (CAAX protease family)